MPSTIVLTGVTRGIGRIALDQLVERTPPDTCFVILARDPAGAELADHLRGAGIPASSIGTDLASMRSVAAAARDIVDQLESEQLPPLQAVVANAGIQLVDDVTATDEGFEVTFAVNVLANHVLIRALQPCLQPDTRIVVTVSDTHFGDFKHNMGMVPGPQWPQDPQRLTRIGAFDRPEKVAAGRTAYSTSKLAAIHLVHEYARRLPATVVSYNPGFVPGTELARNAGAFSRFAVRRIMPMMTLTPMATSAKAAGRYLADAVLGATTAPSGGYIDRAAAGPSSEESYDPHRECQLWEMVEGDLAELDLNLRTDTNPTA